MSLERVDESARVCHPDLDGLVAAATGQETRVVAHRQTQYLVGVTVARLVLFAQSLLDCAHFQPSRHVPYYK